MIIDNPTLTPFLDLDLLFKGLFIVFSVLYFIFSLIVIRQISLMTETVSTESGGLLRAFSILHAGLSLAVIVLFVGIL